MNGSLLEHALAVVDRGWAVFPCHPRSKNPAGEVVRNGCKNATRDRDQLIAWWKRNPLYNPAIDLAQSGLSVMDCDEGLADQAAAEAWYSKWHLPPTFVVRTGRRTSFGLQFYFAGLVANKSYTHDGVSGEIRSVGHYVMAPGAVHPLSGESYVILADRPLAPVPDLILKLSRLKTPNPKGRSLEKIKKSARHEYLKNRSIALYHGGLGGDGLLAALRWLNENRCDPPLTPGDFNANITRLVKWNEEKQVRRDLWRFEDLSAVRHLSSNERWQRAFDGHLEDFNGDANAALNFLTRALLEIGCDLDQIERILRASSLPEEVLR